MKKIKKYGTLFEIRNNFKWEKETYYTVEVAFPESELFRALFFSGLLDDDGMPGNYNEVLNCGEGKHSCYSTRYMKVMKRIISKEEIGEISFRSFCHWKEDRLGPQ